MAEINVQALRKTAIDAARIYLEAQESGLAREKAHVESFAGKPAPTVHSRFIQARINKKQDLRKTRI